MSFKLVCELQFNLTTPYRYKLWNLTSHLLLVLLLVFHKGFLISAIYIKTAKATTKAVTVSDHGMGCSS